MFAGPLNPWAVLIVKSCGAGVKKNLKNNSISPYFDASRSKNIGATIRIGQEILCLSYAGFFSNQNLMEGKKNIPVCPKIAVNKANVTCLSFEMDNKISFQFPLSNNGTRKLIEISFSAKTGYIKILHMGDHWSFQCLRINWLIKKKIIDTYIFNLTIKIVILYHHHHHHNLSMLVFFLQFEGEKSFLFFFINKCMYMIIISGQRTNKPHC